MAQQTIEISDPLVRRIQSIAATRNLDFERALNFLLERMLIGIAREQPQQLRDYKAQHIPIMLDPTTDRVKKKLRCINCGNPILNYYGGVKLITHGIYDADQNIIDGEEVDWFSKTGVPEEIVCSGRIVLLTDDGRKTKKRCSFVYYRIGA